ncbi:hypothetical protein F4801DRAFT_377435 [Xylaria longipes]|nr:hypothetical protein F4801DRAFT_377435 [Xylaria longipes]
MTLYSHLNIITLIAVLILKSSLHAESYGGKARPSPLAKEYNPRPWELPPNAGCLQATVKIRTKRLSTLYSPVSWKP